MSVYERIFLISHGNSFFCNGENEKLLQVGVSLYNYFLPYNFLSSFLLLSFGFFLISGLAGKFPASKKCHKIITKLSHFYHSKFW